MKISIIIPCHNSEETIYECLLSIQGQSYKNYEIKLVNNLSTDNSLKIVNTFNFKDIEIINENDKGIYDAINKGIEKSEGEIISILHSDDMYYDSQVLQNVVDGFNKNLVKIIYGNLIYVKRKNTNSIIRYWVSNSFKKGSFLKGWSPPHPSFFVKRDLYLIHGKYNLEIGNSADIELMHRYLETYAIKSTYVNKIFIKMRYGGSSNKNLQGIINQNLKILKFLKINKNPFLIFNFITFKFYNRFIQFLVKPK